MAMASNPFLEKSNKFLEDIAEEFSKVENSLIGQLNRNFELIEKEVDRCLKTGQELNLRDFLLLSDVESYKENEEPNVNVEKNSPKRNAKTRASAQVKVKQEKLSNIIETNNKAESNNTETEPDTTYAIKNTRSRLKKEKISTGPQHVEEEKTINEPTFAIPQQPVKLKKVKKEPAQSTRVTRSKRLQKAPSVEEEIRESDVIPRESHIPVVDLTEDSDKESESVKPKGRAKKTKKKETESDVTLDVKPDDKPQRQSTRNKTKQSVNKRLRNEDDDIQAANKKSRSHSNGSTKNNDTSSQTVYQDALSTVENKVEEKKVPEPVQTQVNNETFAIPNKDNLNATYNVNAGVNATFNINDKPPATVAPPKLDELFTDDESDNESKKQTPKKATGPKQVFSPYGKTPLKDKVKAFEQLSSQSSSIPIKHRIGTPDNKVPNKHITPLRSKELNKLTSSKTASSTSKCLSSGKSSSILSTKSASAMKASQAEYTRRKEREQEALKKREALLLAQSEEKRKKREERQLKAQQQREAQEKEKKRLQEIQKLKDEQYQQIIAEKERKLLKIREENDRKRLLAKQKAESAERDNIPKYKLCQPPLLPVQDCYDSDDNMYEKVKPRRPSWTETQNLNKFLHAQEAIGEKLKNTFFNCRAQTPNLIEIFGVMDPEKLKRTSSAVWTRTPGKTSIRHQISTLENSLFEEDV